LAAGKATVDGEALGGSDGAVGGGAVGGLLGGVVGGGVTGWTTVIFLERVSDPPGPVTLSVTVYSPGEPYLCLGFCLLSTPSPSPKSHDHSVILPVLLSLKK